MYVTIMAIGIIILMLICDKICNVKRKKQNKDPLYVNYHLTRQCNYECGFCFHTAKTSYVLSLDEAKKGLKLLAKYGMNISDLI